MAPATPYSLSNITCIPGTAFISVKNNCLARPNLPGNSTKALSRRWFSSPLSKTVGLFPRYRSSSSLQHRSRIHILTATGTELAVEESDSAVAGEVTDESLDVPTPTETSETPSSTADATVKSTAKSQSPRVIRKSDVPPVKNEELVPGATFTGKVRSVQPFGAFVDFGAWTDGLVHISNLSDSFVEDVASIVSVGQEVKVRLVEANTDTKRISLTMRSEGTERRDTGKSDNKPRPARKNTQKRNVGTKSGTKSSKFIKGMELQGTVKNTIRAGSFISLPEGEEGFLPKSEEPEDGVVELTGQSSLEVGQEISVRVLRLDRGKITLTMKKEGAGGVEIKPVHGVVHAATNPFVLAFRKNKDIAAFLDERESVEKVAEPLVVPEISEKIEELTETKSDASKVLEQLVDDQIDIRSVVDNVVEDNITSEEVIEEAEASVGVLDTAPDKSVNNDENPALAVSDSSQSAGPIDEPAQEEELSSSSLLPVESISSVDSLTKKDPVTHVVKEDYTESEQAVEMVSNQISSPEITTSEEVVEGKADESLERPEVLEQQKEEPFVIQNNENEEVVSEKNGSITTSRVDATQETTTKATISPALVKQLREETGAGMMDCKKALAETGDIAQAQEFLRKKGLASADKKANRATAEGRIGSYIHDSRIGVLLEVNCETDFVSRGDIFKELVDDLAMQVAACPQVQYLVTDDVPKEFVNKETEIEMQKEDLQSKPEQFRSKIVEGRIRKRLEELALLEQPYIKNDKMVVKDWVKQTIATIGENIKVKRFMRYNLGEGLEKKNQDFAAEVAAQTSAKASPAAPPTDQPAQVEAEKTIKKPPTVAISAALVKQLREETGAGMMDCKKALAETAGDLEKAQEYLRKKGLSTADKKSGRLAAEGRIGSYVHDSRIGVLIEVNCETDFAGRNENFKEMVDDLAMQVAACPQVQYVSIEDIPESIVSKEKELEMQREDLQSKPENIREKIVEGRISKRLGELALLEQPFIKNDSLLVKDLVKQTVATLGENIKVRRFVRFTLGEVVDDVKEA